MEEWKVYIIKDICKGIYEGPHATPKESQTGGIYLGIPAISVDGHINFKNAKRIAEEDLPLWTKRVTPQEDDIVFTNEATLNLYALIPAGFHGCLGRRLGLVRPNKELVNAKYLFYYFFSPEWRNVISQNKVYGATVERILMTKFPSFPIKLPSLPTQKRIVNILSALDDKIEVNRRINENLEQQAQALFKSWFVDFESFKGGAFVESELGMIPKGWRVESLSFIADYINGLAMQKYRPNEGEKGLPVLKIKELGQGSVDDNSELCSPSLIGDKYIIQDGDIIFSWSGTLMVKVWCGGKCGLNQHLFVVVPKEKPKWFVYQWTKYHLDNFIRIAKDKAVTMGHIKRGELDKAKVTFPDTDTLKKIDSLMEPIFNQIISNELESRRLATIRDTLLPKLMSGELKVNEVEI